MKSDSEKEAGTYILKSYGQFFKKQYQDHMSICDHTLLIGNKTFLPIKVNMTPSELTQIPDLVSSDNTVMTKVLGVLCSLCVEVTNIKKEAFER